MIRGTVGRGFRIRGQCGKGVRCEGETGVQDARWTRDRDSQQGLPRSLAKQEKGLTDSTVRQLGCRLFSSLKHPPSHQQRQRRAGTPIPELGPASFFHKPAPSLRPAHWPRLPPQGPAPVCVTHRSRPAPGAPPAPGPRTLPGSASGISS